MEKGKYAAFRTEGFDDYKRVYPLLEELGLEVEDMSRVPDEGSPNWTLDFFVVKYDGDIECLRNRMEKIISTDERFTDLHRCYQTLAKGTEPNEEWYLPTEAEQKIIDAEKERRKDDVFGDGANVESDLDSDSLFTK